MCARVLVVVVVAFLATLMGCSTDTNAGDGGSGAASGGSGGNAPTGPVPMFPGTGNSDDAKPLVGGMVCDSVPGATLPTVDALTRCFYGPTDQVNPAATIEQVLECVAGTTVLHLRLTFDPSFVDNTYGANSIGWDTTRKGTHTFKDLVGSDHAELVLMDGNGDVAMQFKMDYITEDPTALSGYSALGVTGGEGEISIGNADDILDASTSFDRNLNERGYSSYLIDSPATDADYTPNVDAPGWDYRVVYDVWVDLAAFGDAGFSGAFIEYVHASPAKADGNTVETVPGDCPPSWDPCRDDKPDTYCNDTNPPPTTDPCNDAQPDTYCADGSEPNNPDPPFCTRYPSDPSCMPE